MEYEDSASSKVASSVKRRESDNSAWKMWRNLLSRRRVSSGGIDKISSIRNCKISRDSQNKTLTVSKLTILSIEPCSLSKRDGFTSTKNYFCDSSEKTVGSLKLNILNISPMIRSIGESATQTGTMTTSVSTQTPHLKEILETTFGRQINQQPVKFNFKMHCMSDHSLEDDVEKISQMISALQDELDLITSPTKSHQNFTCSPSKRKRLEPRVNPPQTDRYAFTDETLQEATDKLIEELWRVKLQNGVSRLQSDTPDTSKSTVQQSSALIKGNNSKYSKSLYKVTTIPVKSAMEQIIPSRKRVQSKDQSLRSFPEKTYVYFNKKAVFEQHEGLRENPNSDVQGKEGTSEFSNLDWLEWVRRITHDMTLTPQQKDEELDRVVDALAENRNPIN